MVDEGSPTVRRRRLAAELRTLKADVKPAPDAPVFPSAAGTRQERNRVRARVLGKAAKRADEALAAADLAALPEGLTLHALRARSHRC